MNPPAPVRFVKMPHWLRMWCRDQKLAAGGTEFLRFLLDATIYFPTHRHRAEISERQWLITGILAKDGKTVIVPPAKIGRFMFYRYIKLFREAGILIAERYSAPRPMFYDTPAGGRFPIVYALVQEQGCVCCGQRFTGKEAPQPKPERFQRKRPKPKVVEFPAADAPPRKEPHVAAAAAGGASPYYTPPGPANAPPQVETGDRARDIAARIHWYMSGGFQGGKPRTGLNPENDPSILQDIVRASGNAPIRELELLMIDLNHQGKQPFNGRGGPYNNAFWVSTIFQAYGKRYGGIVPHNWNARVTARRKGFSQARPSEDRSDQAVNDTIRSDPPPAPKPAPRPAPPPRSRTDGIDERIGTQSWEFTRGRGGGKGGFQSAADIAGDLLKGLFGEEDP